MAPDHPRKAAAHTAGARHAAQRGAAGAEAAEVGGGAAVAEHLQEVDLEQEMCEIS
jgi:hypothetical protein